MSCLDSRALADDATATVVDAADATAAADGVGIGVCWNGGT